MKKLVKYFLAGVMIKASFILSSDNSLNLSDKDFSKKNKLEHKTEVSKQDSFPIVYPSTGDTVYCTTDSAFAKRIQKDLYRIDSIYGNDKLLKAGLFYF